MVVALCALWVRVFYFGDLDAVALVSYRAADLPPVPAVPWQLGVHTFGDFLLPYAQAIPPNPWLVSSAVANNYPPALVLVFKLFTLLRYAVALAIFLVLNVAAMALPVVLAVRRLLLPVAILCVCVFVFLTFPFVMVVDRANVQGLITLVLYAFAVAWRDGRWRRAAVALAVATALKVYPAVLVLGLLAERRFREAALALGGAAAATLLLFAMFPGGLIATAEGFLTGLMAFSTPNPSRFVGGNYSVAGMLANLAAACFGMASPALWWLLTHPWHVGFVYLAGAAAVVFARRLPFVVRMACAMSVLTFVIPLSYGYTLAFIAIVVAELLRNAVADDRAADLPRPLAFALGCAVASTLAPWAFRMPVTGSSVGTVIVPAAWVLLVVTALVAGYSGTVRSMMLRRGAGVRT